MTTFDYLLSEPQFESFASVAVSKEKSTYMETFWVR